MCDLGGFRHGTAGYLLTEDRIYHRARYSPQECDEIISIQDIEKYAAVTGYWFDDDLPVYFDELEESEYKTNDYTAFILQYENGKQCLLYVKEYYEDVSNVLYAIVFANRISKAERKAVINAGDKAFNGKDYGKAFQYYAKAYDVEIAKGARMIGYMYDHGLGVARNDKLALEWYLKAAENGDVDAQFI